MANESNLIPAKKGEVRNPKGKPKGTIHLSTHIQNLLNDEEFDTYIQHPTKGYIEYKGAPIKAIINVAVRKALAGDHNAMEWLAKHGYGNTLNVNIQENALKLILHKFEIEGNDAGEVEEIEERTSS